MSQLLVSVRDADEGRMAAAAGAAIVDLKDPADGALGPASAASILALRAACPDAVLSAVVAERAESEDAIAAAQARIAAAASAGYDYVKFGCAGDDDVAARLTALGLPKPPLATIVVWFADDLPGLAQLSACRRLGVTGVMIDTRRKFGGHLLKQADPLVLGDFVARARAQGLATGLAGGLAIADLAAVRRLVPDVIGMRGGLCNAGAREDALNEDRLREAIAVLGRPIPEAVVINTPFSLGTGPATH